MQLRPKYRLVLLVGKKDKVIKITQTDYPTRARPDIYAVTKARTKEYIFRLARKIKS